MYVQRYVVFVGGTIYVGRAHGRIYLWRIVRVAALSPYQHGLLGSWVQAPHIETAKHKTRRRRSQEEEAEQQLEGKGSRGSDVTTEIKSNANTKLHYPSHTLANLSPFSHHSFYIFLISPLSLSRGTPSSLSFVSPSPFLCFLLSFSFSFVPPPFALYRDAALPQSRTTLLPPSHFTSRSHLSLGNNPLTVRAIWSGTGEQKSDRKRTGCIRSSSPRLRIRSNPTIPLLLAFLLFSSPFPPPVRESNSARVSREVMRASLKAR